MNYLSDTASHSCCHLIHSHVSFRYTVDDDIIDIPDT